MPTIHIQRNILNKHFLSAALGKAVKEFRIRKENKPEDSIVSNLLTVDVMLESGEILNLLYKCMNPKNTQYPIYHDSDSNNNEVPFEAKFRAALEGYTLEILFYKKILPLLNQKLGTSLVLVPKLFAHEESEYDSYLLLENLSPFGFRTPNKFKGMGFEEVALVMANIAKLHALSFPVIKHHLNEIVCDQKSKALVEKHPLLTRVGASMKPIAEMLYSGVQQLMESKVPRDLQDAVARMSKFKDFVVETILAPWEAAKTRNDPVHFPVLVHGDLWATNILVKYSDSENGNNPIDLRFVDFQQTRISSPYEDLVYFLYCSTTSSFRHKYLKEVLKIYAESFMENLNALGEQPPEGFSVNSCFENYQSMLPYAFCYFIFAIPFQLGIQAPPESPAVVTPDDDSPENARKFDIVQPAPEKSLKDEIEEFLPGLAFGLLQGYKISETAIERTFDIIREMQLYSVL